MIPKLVFESKIPLAMSGEGEMLDEFQRDDEIDMMERDELARVIKDEQQVYSEDEDFLVQQVQDKLGALKEEDFEELELPDHLVKMGKTFLERELYTDRSGLQRSSRIETSSPGVCGRRRTTGSY